MYIPEMARATNRRLPVGLRHRGPQLSTFADSSPLHLIPQEPNASRNRS